MEMNLCFIRKTFSYLACISLLINSGLFAETKTQPQKKQFDFEVITLFPDTSDTVFAANQKTIFTKITPFSVVDTIWSFTIDTLPHGFVVTGGHHFRFGNQNLQIPPVILGMKYDSLPAGISESDCGLYQKIDGQLHKCHGSWISNGAVWDTVSSEQLAYPFLILADTLTPIISLYQCTDTVSTGANIPTFFGISDNSANVHWQFLYGPGHGGYDYGDEGYLTTCIDTSLKTVIVDQNNTINESFGVRALIIARDGINADTVNVSRCVRSSMTEVCSIIGNEWVPLRTAAGLDEPALEVIFDASTTDPDPWQYDEFKQRIYRWHSLSPDKPNKWIEYSDPVKDIFSFIPGRTIWCKSAGNTAISFGCGVTVSLKEPYEIKLKPGNWTDISSPFQFPVMWRDILDATGVGSDSLEIYQWVKSGSIYEAMDIYIASLDTITAVTDTLASRQKHDAYTIYNYSYSWTILRIPPISLPLSKYSNGKYVRQRHYKTLKNIAPSNQIPLSTIWEDGIIHPDPANGIVPVSHMVPEKLQLTTDFYTFGERIFFTIPSVDIQEVRIAVYSLTGRRVLTKTVSGGTETCRNVLQLDTSRLSKGVYCIRMAMFSKSGIPKKVLSKKVLLSN